MNPHQSYKLDPDPRKFTDDKPKCMENEPIWALFLRFWAFLWKLGSRSLTASKWKVDSRSTSAWKSQAGSGSSSKWQAGSGSASKWQAGFGSGYASKWQAGSGSASSWCGSATLVRDNCKTEALIAKNIAPDSMGGGMFPEPREAVSVRPPWPALPGRCRWRAAGDLRIKYCYLTNVRPFMSIVCTYQCSRSMTYWCGSGFADPCLWGSGSRSCYFYHWPSRRQQKTHLFKKVFLLITFWRYPVPVHLHHSSKISPKDVKKQ